VLAKRCNTLQHILTHCNTLQQTVAHCSILKLPKIDDLFLAKLCNTMQQIVTHLNLRKADNFVFAKPRRAISGAVRWIRLLQYVAVCCSVLQCVAVS